MPKDKKTDAPEQSAKETSKEVIQQIKKATYNKSGLNVEFVEATIVEGKGDIITHTINNPQPPHPDLLEALTILLPHFLHMSPLAPLFPQIDAKYIKGRNILSEPKDSLLNIFEVNGVTFSGTDGTADYTVQIIGRMKYPNGKVVSMTLAGERLFAEGGYANKEQLMEDINSFIDEVDKFVNHGKRYQLALELANGNDER